MRTFGATAASRALTVAIIASLGCGRAPHYSSGRADVRAEAASPVQPQRADSSNRPAIPAGERGAVTESEAPARAAPVELPPDDDQPRVTTLRHNFGRLKPNQRVAHVFRIRNDSELPWTVKHISRLCNCAVAKMSSTRLAPGSTEEATVTYRAPSRLNDDHRVIEIRFQEPGSPVIRLEVTAAIRPSIVLSSDVLQLACLHPESPATAAVQVENYSDADWQDVAVVADQPWLSAAPELLRGQQDPDAARQIWRLAVTADGSAVQPGRYSGELRLICRAANREGDGGHTAVLPVNLHATGPIELMPERMFFGNLSDEGEGKCTVRVRCLAFSPEFVASNLVLRHDMGDWLRLEVARAAKRVVEIKGRISLPKAVETAKGSIELTIDDVMLRLPVHAMR